MLRTRLYLGLLALFIVVVGTGAYAILVCHQLADTLQKDLVSHYEDILSLQQMRASANLMATSLGPARTDPLGAQTQFTEARSAFTRALMAQSQSSAGTPRAELVTALDGAYQPFEANNERLLQGGGDASLDAIRANEANLYRVNQAINRLTQNDYEASRAVAVRAQDLALTTQRVLLGVMATAFLLFILLGWRLANSILTPIKALTASVVAIGEGNLDSDVQVVSGDELGILATAFNAMAKKLRAYREATLAKVLRTQRTMEATLTSTPDPVFVVSRDGTNEIRNPAAMHLAQSGDFAARFPPSLQEPLDRVLASGDHYLPTDYRRVVALRLGREDHFYLPRILAIGDKLTEFVGAAIILQDVTKFRLLDDAKTNLVGTVSHELKTPLTSLRMAVYLSLEESQGPLTAKQRELLEDARDDSDRLLRMLDSLLDLARLEAGASALVREEVAVTALLAGIAAEARGFVEPAGQTLLVQEEGELGAVAVDRERLRHVFTNLLTNASKYSPAGSTILLKAEPAPLGFVRFSVRDAGRGIPEASLPRLFDRFYRVPDQDKPGAGIGLAIAREIVVAHGGSIGATSELGRGSEFHFLIPKG